MMRLCKSNANRLSHRLLTTATPRTFNFPKIKETGFESQWRKLSEAEKDQVEKEYMEIGKKNWHELTFDQMRASSDRTIIKRLICL